MLHRINYYNKKQKKNKEEWELITNLYVRACFYRRCPTKMCNNLSMFYLPYIFSAFTHVYFCLRNSCRLFLVIPWCNFFFVWMFRFWNGLTDGLFVLENRNLKMKYNQFQYEKTKKSLWWFVSLFLRNVSIKSVQFRTFKEITNLTILNLVCIDFWRKD